MFVLGDDQRQHPTVVKVASSVIAVGSLVLSVANLQFQCHYLDGMVVVKVKRNLFC